ncbi:hypothetical protein, partial [Pseudomonas grimontii]|uniref:hypothetical protein n=1 Tax=Pseudomonas grimontii TaxID=129847 RepID=UPI00387B75B5
SYMFRVVSVIDGYLRRLNQPFAFDLTNHLQRIRPVRFFWPWPAKNGQRRTLQLLSFLART